MYLQVVDCFQRVVELGALLSVLGLLLLLSYTTADSLTVNSYSFRVNSFLFKAGCFVPHFSFSLYVSHPQNEFLDTISVTTLTTRLLCSVMFIFFFESLYCNVSWNRLHTEFTSDCVLSLTSDESYLLVRRCAECQTPFM